MDSAEKALLTILTQPSLARAMGSAAATRAKSMFAPEKVMNAYEDLFAELSEIRNSAPDDAFVENRVSPQIDPVRVFAGFASHPAISVKPSLAPLEALPEPVRQQRNSIWQLLQDSAHHSARQALERDLVKKHQQVLRSPTA